MRYLQDLRRRPYGAAACGQIRPRGAKRAALPARAGLLPERAGPAGGLAKQTLSGLEAGQANPTVLTLNTIAGALGIPVAHLLTEYGSPVLVRKAPSGPTALTGPRGNSTRPTSSARCAPRSSGTPGPAMRRSSTEPTGPASIDFPAHGSRAKASSSQFVATGTPPIPDGDG
jgi:transcriptional regulator with XRE-family HTH domain